MYINDFLLVNAEKLDRALNGTPMSDSSRKGGVGKGAYNEDGKWFKDGEELNEKEVATLEANLLAEYDKLGGLITRNGDVVKTGSFYDFKGRRAYEKPRVFFLYRVNGKQIEVEDGKELPGVVKAAKLLAEEEKALEEDVPTETVTKKKTRVVKNRRP